MRTTIDLGPDVLAQAKELASLQRKSLGFVISTLVRERLSTPHNLGSKSPKRPHKAARPPTRNGVVYIAKQDRQVSLEQIQAIRDQEGI